MPSVMTQPVELDEIMPVTVDSESDEIAIESPNTINFVGNTNRYHRGVAVGGTGGRAFSAIPSNNPSARLTRIHFTATGGRARLYVLRSVRLTWDDGTSVEIGGTGEEEIVGQATFQFRPDEVLTELQMGQRTPSFSDNNVVAYIGLRTNQGRRFQFGNQTLAARPLTDAGSGELIGFLGRAGTLPDQLTPIFVEQPIAVEVFDVQYDLDGGEIPATLPTVLVSENFRNESDMEIEASTELSTTVGEESSWEHTVGVAAGISTSIETGIPFVAGGELEVSLEASYGYSWGGNIVRETTVGQSVSFPVPPRSMATAQLGAGQSVIEVPFQGTLKATYLDGTFETMPTSGIYEGASHHDLQTTVLPIEPIPEKNLLRAGD